MSISIKNITLAIDGTQSNMFKMEIDGGKYRLDNFTLVQTLMKPNTLKFIMYKDPEEDVNEPQFSICKTIIGKPISLTLQTDPMEQEIPSFSDEGKTADIEFEGIIMSASGSRRESQYIISVEAHTWEALLIDNPNCKSYEDSTLEDIVNDVINPCGQLQPKVNPRYQDIIPYTVQYNENNYQFISRLAKRYGEWFYNDGKQLVFGNMPESEPVQLAYPSKDIPSYSIRMKMLHVPFRHVASSYQEHNSSSKEGKEEMEKEYNELNTSVYNASMENYQKETWQNLHSGGYADEDSREKILNVSSKTQARGEKASMLIYEGQTYSSRLKLGGKLVIKDNYISDSSSNDKSDVDLDEIIITSLTHHFTSDERYSNMFEGIPSACDYPPYLDPEAYPKATPCRAIVYDTEDPMHLGRIRVQFWWQYQRYIDNAPDKEQLYSPWLRIAYPYAGPNKGYNFIPECEEEVMIDFEGGNAERPYVNGALFDGILKPDEKWYPGDNEVKAIRTRNDHTIEIHDKGKGGYIHIYDNKKNNYSLTFSTDEKKIKIQSAGNIELSAGNDIILHAGGNFRYNIGSNFETKVAGKMVLEVAPANPVPPVEQITSPGEPVSEQLPEKAGGGESLFMLEIENGKMELTTDNIKEEARQDKTLKATTLKHVVKDNFKYVYSEGAPAVMSIGRGSFIVDTDGSISMTSKFDTAIKAFTFMSLSATTINMN